MEPVKTSQIYWGAVPFVVIQLIMVGLVIAFPQMVMHYKDGAVVIDEKKAMEQFQLAPAAGEQRGRRLGQRGQQVEQHRWPLSTTVGGAGEAAAGQLRHHLLALAPHNDVAGELG